MQRQNETFSPFSWHMMLLCKRLPTFVQHQLGFPLMIYCNVLNCTIVAHDDSSLHFIYVFKTSVSDSDENIPDDKRMILFWVTVEVKMVIVRQVSQWGCSVIEIVVECNARVMTYSFKWHGTKRNKNVLDISTNMITFHILSSNKQAEFYLSSTITGRVTVFTHILLCASA